MLEYNFIQFGQPDDGFAKPIGAGERFPFYPEEGELLTLVTSDGTMYPDRVRVEGNVASIVRPPRPNPRPIDGTCCRLMRYYSEWREAEGWGSGTITDDGGGVKTDAQFVEGHPFHINIDYANNLTGEEGTLYFRAIYDDGTGDDLGSVRYDAWGLATDSFDVPAQDRPGYVYVYFEERSGSHYEGGVEIDFNFYQEYEEIDSYEYSNRLVWVSGRAEEESLVEFKCDKDEFGFPFASGGAVATWLPILLTEPQYKQSDKVYTKSDGKVVVLYAQHYKERNGQTEYMPESMHDKVIVALSCDEVRINGTLLTKSDEYSVDWEHYDTTYADVKTARATFKMQANTINRNSNY